MFATVHAAPLLAVVATAKPCRPKFTPGLTVSVFSLGVPTVTRNTTAYDASAPAEPACGITIAGVSGHVKYPLVAVTPPGTVPVPVTSAAPPVGFNVASAAHRSQDTVAVPYAVAPANEMLDSLYPYDGFGTITAAAHAVVDILYFVVAVTVDASRLRPVLVVSTST